MFKKTMLAVATAGLIAVGALGATTSAASAGGYDGQGSGGMQYGGPGRSLQFGFGNSQPQFHPQKVCKPVFKKVKWWDRWGNPHRSMVVVGQKCFFVRGHRHHRNDDGPWDDNGRWDNDPWNNNGPGGGGGW